MSSEDDVYIFKIKAHAMRHVFLGTIMIINVLVWFIGYPLQRKHVLYQFRKKEKQSKFYLSKIYGIFMIAQCNVCWSSITYSQIESGFLSNMCKYIACIALTTIFICRMLMSIDIYCGAKFKSHKLRKKWVTKYGIIAGALVYNTQTILCFGAGFDTGLTTAYILLMTSMIVFLVSLYILKNSAIKHTSNTTIDTTQLKIIIGCQVINFVLSILIVPTATSSSSWILGLTGIFGYLCFTLFLKSGIIDILDFLSTLKNANVNINIDQLDVNTMTATVINT